MNQESLTELIAQVRSLTSSGNVDDALAVAHTAFSRSEEAKIEQRIEVLLLLGDLYFSKEDLHKAEDWYKKSIFLIKEAFGVDDPYHVHPVLKLGIICRLQDDLETSEKFFIIGYDIFIQGPTFVETEQAEVLLIELAELSLTLRSDNDAALMYYQRLEDLHASQGKHLATQSFVFLKKASCLLRLGRLDEAKAQLEKIVAEYSNPHESVRKLVLYALHAHCSKNMNAEQEWYEKGIEKVGHDKDCEDYYRLHYLQASLFLRRGEEMRAHDIVKMLASSSDGDISAHPSPDEGNLDYLKDAGFHVVAALSEEEASTIRTELLGAIDSFMERGQSLSAYALLDNIMHSSMQVSGQREPLAERLEQLKAILPVAIQST